MTLFNFIILFFCAWFYYVGLAKDRNVPIYSEPQFEYIVTKFNQEASLRNLKVNLTNHKILFSDLEYELAHCYYGLEYLRVIRIDRKSWSKMTQEEREALLFHELGHCALGRIEHFDSMFNNGCPVSIMHRTHTLKDCYLKNRSDYLDELFQQKRNE